jgi:membrane-bound lytic murein transglycosylase B
MDKSRAEIADENYSKASVDLKNLGSVTSAPQIVASVGDMLTTVDWVLGTAESTTSRATSPVSEAHEDLPTAATAVPVVVAAVTSSTNAPQSYPSSTDAPTMQSSTESNGGSAVGMVQNYYRLWNAREYQTMYGMLSQRMQQNTRMISM